MLPFIDSTTSQNHTCFGDVKSPANIHHCNVQPVKTIGSDEETSTHIGIQKVASATLAENEASHREVVVHLNQETSYGIHIIPQEHSPITQELEA